MMKGKVLQPPSGYLMPKKHLQWLIPMTWKGVLAAFILCLLASFIISPAFIVPPKLLQEGGYAYRDIKAPKSFGIVDKEATEIKRHEAEDLVPSIYDHDGAFLAHIEERLREAFDYGRKTVLKTEPLTIEVSSIDPYQQLQQRLAAEISPELFAFLKKKKFVPELEQRILMLIASLKNQLIVLDKEFLMGDKETGILAQEVENPGILPTPIHRFDHILDLKEARQKIQQLVPAEILSNFSLEEQKQVADLAAAVVIPNLTLNKVETQRRKEEARQGVKNVTIPIKKGEMIIRDGELVQKRHVIIVDGIRHELREQSSLLLVFFTALFLFFTLLSWGILTLREWPKKLPYRKDCVVAGLLFLFVLGITVLFLSIAEVISDAFPWIPLTAFQYFIPVAAAAMTIRFLVSFEFSIPFSFFLSLGMGILLEKNFYFMVYAFISSLVGTSYLSTYRDRKDIFKASFIVGQINFFMVISILSLSYFTGGALQPRAEFLNELLMTGLAAFSGGLICSLLVVGGIPIFESLFNYTTDIKLLELANLNNPILRELGLRAPGTYHHSLILGTLVEAAAEAIGARALKARVSAYYHDIGKLRDPHYYIENQKGENIHDKLPPHLSKMMIMSHVKEGVKLAEEYKLGRPIIEAITQHHGTTLVRYFYHKAKEMADPSVQEVREEDYRYEGPKPQTRETALVMLADGVEATARTVREDQVSRLQEMITRTIHRLFSEGQLDECDLTLYDLNKIAKSFHTVLVAIRHRRIVYPNVRELERHDRDYARKEHEEISTEEPDREDTTGDPFHRMGI